MARKMNSLTVVGGGGSGPQSGITRENYVEKAREFVRAHGGVGFVIRVGDGTDLHWISWMRYLDCKGVPTRFARSHGVTTVPSEWPKEFDAEAFEEIDSSPSRRLPPIDLVKEPWLKNARREGNVIPSREVDRCWQDHLRSHMLGTASGPLFPHRLSRNDQPISPERRLELANMLRDIVAKATLPVNERPAQPEAPKRPLTAEELAEVYRQRDAKNGPLRLSQEVLEALQARDFR